jgi:hypothetical protein
VGDDHVHEALAFRQLPLAPADAQTTSLLPGP